MFFGSTSYLITHILLVSKFPLYASCAHAALRKFDLGSTPFHNRVAPENRHSASLNTVKTRFKMDVTALFRNHILATPHLRPCNGYKAAPERVLGNADFNFEFCSDDNCCLIVHEYSGLESQGSDSQGSRTIRGNEAGHSALER